MKQNKTENNYEGLDKLIHSGRNNYKSLSIICIILGILTPLLYGTIATLLDNWHNIKTESLVLLFISSLFWLLGFVAYKRSKSKGGVYNSNIS